MDSPTEQTLLDAVARIRDAHWQQCSVFRPSNELLPQLPNYMALQDDEWLVIATQTCSIVSCSLEKERLVEVIAAKPLKQYNPNHSRAKGNENVYFHLPIKGHLSSHDISALECDLGRRAFFPRKFLENITPEKTWCEPRDLNAFKGWIANYYTRVALPDELLKRLREDSSGLIAQISQRLEHFISGKRVSDSVKAFYISWLPDKELHDESPYEIQLIAACTNEESAKYLDKEISSVIENSDGLISINRVIVSEWYSDLTDNITLDQLEGKFRFGEWDKISSQEEKLDAIREMPS